MRNVIRKLQARNRVHAIALALERGEIALDAPPTGAERWPTTSSRALVHDLRTPLTVVEGFSDLLARRADDCPRRSARSTSGASRPPRARCASCSTGRGR